MSDERAEQMAQIAAEIDSLTESPLYDYRVTNHYRPVIGEGSVTAEIMFIGEAPGEMEAKTGRPFVGPAGRVLDSLLESIGLVREEVYITSVVKDRPPDNRDPRAKEVRLYAPFLWRQILIIQPKVIAPLGRHALDFVRKHFPDMTTEGSISTLHGTAIPVEAEYGRVFIVPLYHPAAVFYREDLKEAMEEDFRLLGKLITHRRAAA
jgi:DNA polymerase